MIDYTGIRIEANAYRAKRCKWLHERIQWDMIGYLSEPKKCHENSLFVNASFSIRDSPRDERQSQMNALGAKCSHK